ncbi:MAG: DUF4433 domain-containing protein [Bacteroidaceae bacterium]|nr:DUF4433 domain-containing protein [Bacteroidaceae bacterium]
MPVINNSSIQDFLRSKGITKLYHFTDRSNIQSIIDNDGLFSWKDCNNMGISVNRPGGSDTSHSIDSYLGLDGYVRLCFTKNHPMMYVAKNDGRIEDPVVLEIDLSVVELSWTKFSDRNAARNGAVIKLGLSGARNIHFSTVRQPTHFNLSDDEKEYYQAEVLILEKVPISYISNITSFGKPRVPRTTGKIRRQPSNGQTTNVSNRRRIVISPVLPANTPNRTAASAKTGPKSSNGQTTNVSNRRRVVISPVVPANTPNRTAASAKTSQKPSNGQTTNMTCNTNNHTSYTTLSNSNNTSNSKGDNNLNYSTSYWSSSNSSKSSSSNSNSSSEEKGNGCIILLVIIILNSIIASLLHL